MCGIAAYLDATSRTDGSELAAVAARMADRMSHRGPDDAGVWVDERSGMALSHRRLSIVDLSPEGHQPMTSAGGRYVVSFNGEIYNYLALRDELLGRGHPFRGGSDTEVLLAAVEEWGLDGALARFNGMFAFALWDARERVLHVARDRLGEKPLYYAWLRGAFVAASELKALRAHRAFTRELSRAGLALYMRHGYIPAPYSIYACALKLPPGNVLTVSAKAPGLAVPRAYWSAGDAVEKGRRDPFTGSEAEAIEELERALRDAVRLRMHADVPLGAFLSGGIDSSTVVALMQAQSARPVKTFSIGFREAEYDEAAAARAVAAHLRTDHAELYVTPREALDVIPLIPALYDEPFADTSQIPTFIVSRFARRSVTVSLSGDGGDELFGGYTRYLIGRSLWRNLGWMPGPLRRRLAALISALPPRWEAAALPAFARLLPASANVKLRPGLLRRLADLLSFDDAGHLYRDLVSTWRVPGEVFPAATGPASAPAFAGAWATTRPLVERMMLCDAVSYLPDDILVKLDRASMGVSLEARVPLLDHHLFELAWRLPLTCKIRGGATKWILRQVLHRYVPARLVERPKQGFAVPMNRWLRGPLREWAQTLLAEDRLRGQGILDAKAVGRVLQAHLAGTHSLGGHLWTVLMFQAWLDASEAEAKVEHHPRATSASSVERDAVST